MLRKNAKDYRVRRPPNTAAGRALHAVAAFFGAIARTVLRRKNAEAARQSLDVGGVLETFLREGEMFRNSTMANAEAARDARNRSTVVDEVTAEDFERTFGIRLVMDGDARSQDTADVCYDTLLKLAKLMGVPHETLGIGGLLTLDVSVVEELLNPVFHPTNNTINLTIPNNINVPEIATAATIVHEWTHALDRIVGLGRDADPNVEITEETTGALSHGIGPQVREELLQAGKRMTEALRNTRFYERISNDEEIKELDREDPEAQLFDPQEVFARALANYYLANELGRIPMVDEGLGPTMEELDEVGPILREFFSALKVGVNETTGVQTLYHDPKRTEYRPTRRKVLEEIVGRVLTQTGKNKRQTVYTVRFSDGVPPVLEQCGIHGTGIVALPRKIKYACDNHHFNAAMFAELPERLENPVAVFMGDDGKFVVLTDLLADDKTGRMAPVMVVLENGDETHPVRLVTTYSRAEKSEGYYREAFKDDKRLLYLDTERATRFSFIEASIVETVNAGGTNVLTPDKLGKTKDTISQSGEDVKSDPNEEVLHQREWVGRGRRGGYGRVCA